MRFGSPVHGDRASMTKHKRPHNVFQARAKATEKDQVREAWHKYIETEILDKLVENGIFRVVGVRADGRKVYASNEEARCRYQAPKKRQ
jgi:hypothetical protein